MLGSIYTGLSGLNAFSRGLQTISNNVANLNTPGFKAGIASFRATDGAGGNGLSFDTSIDPSETGNGVRFAEARTDFSQGDLRESDGDLDLAIQGSGFLVLLRGDEILYSRTGQFIVDSTGFVSQAMGEYRLGVLDSAGRAVALNVDSRRTNPPSVTTRIAFADNLSSSATTATVADIAVFDALGGKHVWTAKFERAAGAAAEWTVSVTDDQGTALGSKQLKFIGSTVDPATEKLTFEAPVAGAATLSVVLDFSSGVTSFSAGTASTLRAANVDGNAPGTLNAVAVDADGVVKLSYSNGKSDSAGAVAIADFRDEQGLRQIGDGLYEYGGIGERRLVAGGSPGVGRVLARQTEAANVDLSSEFGNLILIQRGFQASSQVVSVTNDMIQQLFGIRGQS
jgi:flagellar hook protein FlgE